MIVAFRSTPPSFSTVPSEHILRPCNLSTSHLQAIPNSFPCHTSAKSARNSFRCHTYKFALPQVLSLPHIQKTGGVPLWECGGLAAAFAAANLAPQISHV